MSTSFVITVYCAEGHPEHGDGLVDALCARGYMAELAIGPNAEDALRVAAQDNRARLRVLLVGTDLDPGKLARLHRGIDPANRGDLLILKGESTAWKLSERVCAFERQARQRRAVRTRTTTAAAPRIEAPAPSMRAAKGPARGPSFAAFPTEVNSAAPVLWWIAGIIATMAVGVTVTLSLLHG